MRAHRPSSAPVEADLAGGEAVVGAHPQLSWARVSVAALTARMGALRLAAVRSMDCREVESDYRCSIP